MRVKKFDTLSTGGWLVALLFLLSACGTGDFELEKAIEYMPAKENEEDNWGFVNQSGEFAIRDEFKNQPSVVVNGYFYVEENDGYTLYKMGETPVSVKDGENLKSVGLMNEDRIPVTPANERIILLDGKGQKLTTLRPVKGKEIVACDIVYSNGLLLIINEDGKRGYINRNGEVAIELKYDVATIFFEGLAIVGNKNNDGKFKYSVIDLKGEKVFSIKSGYEPASFIFQDGYLILKDSDGRFALMDKKGEITRLPAKVAGVETLNKDFLVFCDKDGKYGVLNINKFDDIIIKPRYSSIKLLGNKFVAKDDNSFYMIDKNGDRLFKFDTDYSSFSAMYGSNFKFSFIAEDGNRYVLLNEDGKPYNRNDFISIGMNLPCLSVESDYKNIGSSNEAEAESDLSEEVVEVVEAQIDTVVEPVRVEPAPAVEKVVEPDFSSGKVYLKGKVNGKYGVHVCLNMDSYTGTYYYDRYGPSNPMTLDIESFDGSHLVMSEYNKYGEYCGTWSGNIRGNKYTGSGVYNGKNMPFNLTVSTASAYSSNR